MEEKIKKILDEYFGLSPRDVWDDRVRDAATKSILSLLSKLVDEAIGKDFDKIPDNPKIRELHSVVEYLNYFRAEQRANLKKLLGEGVKE